MSGFPKNECACLSLHLHQKISQIHSNKLATVYFLLSEMSVLVRMYCTLQRTNLSFLH